MKLCIAEKPSVAKDIADVIGAKTKKNGFYEGNGYWVTWTFGHLCTLKMPDDYNDQWKYWDMSSLPMIPKKFGIKLIENGGVKKQFKTIESLVDKCEEVINCGDAGQEGELIQRWVLTKAKSKKPLKRLWISSLTEESIKEGFANLKEGSDYDNLYFAGGSRAIGDWLLGMNASRVYTLKYGNGKHVLSIGRVQTPTLAMIVERQLEIDNFKPTTYWEIETSYRDVTFSCTEGRFLEKEKAETKLSAITDQPFEVTSFEKKEGKEYAPKLFDLTSLQVECNRKLGMSAEQTLNTVQNLYEKKLVTYPRVDTTFLPNDMYPKCPGILKGMRSQAQLTAPLQGKKLRKSKKYFDDKKITDHHAIIPTGRENTPVGGREKDVYELISLRFIAIFYPDCKVANTTVLGESQGVEFKATGKQILEPGWREVYGGTQEEDLMPLFEKGESGPHTPELLEKKTKPPKYFTEASLLRAMETAGKQVDDDELRDLMKENGIGRPSTRANIIETLVRRKYITKKKKRIVATEMGLSLIDIIQNEDLKSPELTGQWEKKLREIENGEFSAGLFKSELIKMVTKLVNEVKFKKTLRKLPTGDEKKAKSPPPKLESLTCPVCQKGTMISGKTAYGCSEWKNGCKFIIPFKVMEKKLTLKQVADLIQKKKTSKLKGFRVGGKYKEGSLALTSDGNIELNES